MQLFNTTGIDHGQGAQQVLVSFPILAISKKKNLKEQDIA
jgi:hypothetical protein